MTAADKREELEAAFPWSANPGAIGQQERMLSLVEDYIHIGGDLLSARQAAARLGVSARTVVRYRALLRSLAGAS